MRMQYDDTQKRHRSSCKEEQDAKIHTHTLVGKASVWNIKFLWMRFNWRTEVEVILWMKKNKQRVYDIKVKWNSIERKEESGTQKNVFRDKFKWCRRDDGKEEVFLHFLCVRFQKIYYSKMNDVYVYVLLKLKLIAMNIGFESTVHKHTHTHHQWPLATIAKN